MKDHQFEFFLSLAGAFGAVLAVVYRPGPVIVSCLATAVWHGIGWARR